MNAHGERDMSARPSVMAPAAGKIVESMLQVMQHSGVKKVCAKAYGASSLRKVRGEVEFFKDVPDSVKAYADAIRDALAELIASLGLYSVEIEASEEEAKKLSEFYGQLDSMFRTPQVQATVEVTKPEKPEKSEKPKKSRCRGKCQAK